MKKVLVVLSLICFIAVNASHAQSPASSAKATKKEASVTPTATAAESHPACCQKGAAAKSCCKAAGEAKACTPAEKAKCAEKMKAEASTDSKTGAETVKN